MDEKPVRDKVIDLVALIYYRTAHEDDVWDEGWELGKLVGWEPEDDEDVMPLDEMRTRLAAIL